LKCYISWSQVPTRLADQGGPLAFQAGRADLIPVARSAGWFTRRQWPARFASTGTFQPRTPGPGTCGTATPEGKLEPGSARDPGTGSGGDVQ